MVAKGFTRKDIADVGFNHGQTGSLDGVVQGNGGVGEGAWVEDSANGFALLAKLPIGVNLVDQLTLVVALHKIHFQAQGLRGGSAQSFDIGQTGVAVLFGFTGAQEIEIGAVENENLHKLSIRWRPWEEP